MGINPPLAGKIDTPPPQERKPHTPRDFGPCLAVPWILENCRFNYAKGAQKLEIHGIIFLMIVPLAAYQQIKVEQHVSMLLLSSSSTM